LLGVLRHGKTSNEGPFTSKRLERLHQARHRKLKDIFHKASHKVKLHSVGVFFSSPTETTMAMLRIATNYHENEFLNEIEVFI
ncbi:hypothetical protein ACDX78_23295, partial [Virgibacillus oceani]